MRQVTDPSTTQVALSPTSVLVSFSRNLVNAIEPCMQSHELGLDHWLALDSLATGGGKTMAELQAHTLTAAPTLTRVVDRLVTRAAVYREADAVDRRKIRVHLSKRGIALHDEVAAAIGAAEQHWLRTHSAALRADLRPHQRQ